MNNTITNTPRLDNFFATSAARLDRWRELNAKAQVWAAEARSGNSRGGRAAVEAALAEVRPLEDFFAYPGHRLMKALAEQIAEDDAMGVARLVLRLSGALLSGSYRYNSGEWETSDDGDANVPDRLPLSPEGGESRRPYFETLFVSPAPAANLPQIAHEIRRLRRVEDAMIYEPVLVGSFEDAIIGTVLNGKIEAVVIYDGIPIPSQHDVPLLRDFLTTYQQLDTSTRRAARNRRDAGARHQAHPPRTRYLPAHRPARRAIGRRSGGGDDPARVLRSRGADGSAPQHHRRRRRPLCDAVFRQPQKVRFATDLHLSRIADRARQVDHQVELDPRHGRVLRPEPVPGRDLRHHRWHRQHARADRQHQGRAGKIRPRRRRRPCVLRDQRHVHVQQDGLPGGDQAGRHRDRRPQLPQVAPLRHGAVGRPAAVCRSLPDDRILDVRRGAAAHHQAGACSISRPRDGSIA